VGARESAGWWGPIRKAKHRRRSRHREGLGATLGRSALVHRYPPLSPPCARRSSHPHDGAEAARDGAPGLMAVRS
jgi:hypothetical protein